MCAGLVGVTSKFVADAIADQNGQVSDAANIYWIAGVAAGVAVACITLARTKEKL
jgi:hypothetical protein